MIIRFITKDGCQRDVIFPDEYLCQPVMTLPLPTPANGLSYIVRRYKKVETTKMVIYEEE